MAPPVTGRSRRLQLRSSRLGWVRALALAGCGAGCDHVAMRTVLSRLFLVFVAHLAAGACAAQEAERPNILFAMADDWGWPHAGAYGDAVVQTPTFDRLCREGARFEHAYVSSPSCTPSRNAILTGQAFYRLGEGANLHSTLSAEHPTFVRLLEQSGYRVGHWRKAWGPGNAKAGGYQGNPCGPNSKFDAFLAAQPEDQPFVLVRHVGPAPRLQAPQRPRGRHRPRRSPRAVVLTGCGATSPTTTSRCSAGIAKASRSAASWTTRSW